jgi:hypothetical protein
MKKTIILKMLLILLCFTTANQIFSQKKEVKQALFDKPVNESNINPENGYIRCVSNEYEDYLQENNPKRLNKEQFEAWIGPIIEKQKQDAINGRTPQTVFNIPVIIHVIHNGDDVNTVASHTGENISYAQAVSQITVMNQDFRRLAGTPGNGSTGYNLGVDCEVNFCLAQRDPFGNASDGVDRVNLGSASWSTSDINTIVKPQTQWDPTRYLNMWTVRFTDTRLLGYAQFPSRPTTLPSNTPGLQGLSTNAGNSNTDGVVAGYDVFGTNAANDGSFVLNPNYNLGRTMSHEVGHWIGLYHIWGDDSVCTGENSTTGDYVADTPDSTIENYSCVVVQRCTGNDMVENYMDYTNDACMNTFTAGQKARMVAVMTNCVNRSTLSSSNGCTPGQVYGLDGTLNSVTATVVGCSTAYTAAVTLINRGTTTMTSAEITYNIDGGANQTYNWTGSIATGVSTVVTINGTATSGAHNFNAILTKVNTVLDQNTTNNTFVKPFEIATNHNETNVVFNFQKDLYARETTWNLKNSAGTALYSSTTYANAIGNTLPALLTQNWTLATNDCYTFTINDSQSDGICCAYGAGYYNIKSSNDTVTLASGASFTSSEVKSFGINLLENDNFETPNSIYVYPNPTKGILNISVPTDFGLPNNFRITNYLGQIIQYKVVNSENDLSVNTSAFSKGVYFITVEKGNEKKIVRFVKE